MIRAGTVSPAGLAEMDAKYGLQRPEADWIGDLKARFGLKFVGE